jgi:signal transduction histidine kinase
MAGMVRRGLVSVGFDVQKVLSGKGKGLSGQINRAAAIRGNIKWDSDQFGTRVRLILPL